MTTVSENTIKKKAQRLARADGKELGRLSMAERVTYLAAARAELERDPQ